jgi:hypothetical protein
MEDVVLLYHYLMEDPLNVILKPNSIVAQNGVIVETRMVIVIAQTVSTTEKLM